MPVLLALYLYISLIFHILEKRLKNLKILVSFISFVDNGLFVSQEKSLEKSTSHLFCNYNVISFLLDQFSLVIKHEKTKIFHFSRVHRVFDLPLDLSTLEGSILHLKNTWYYPGFIFDRKLTFWQHINFYANKALSTVKYMKMFSNSLWDLILNQKCMLYRTCILPIALYSLLLWYYNKVPLT